MQPLLLAILQRFLKLPVVRRLRRHACLVRRNIDVFFLQGMSHRDVESGRRKASSILLYRDMPGLLLGPRVWFFFSITTVESTSLRSV